MIVITSSTQDSFSIFDLIIDIYNCFFIGKIITGEYVKTRKSLDPYLSLPSFLKYFKSLSPLKEGHQMMRLN